MTSYSKRESIFHNGETVYRADPQALSARRPDGTHIDIPWGSVTRARLTYAPTRMKPHRRLLTIASPVGIVNIDDMHFAGIGRFERREADFAAFAGAAADRIAQAAPQAGFFLGAAMLSYIALIMLGLGGLALAGIAILSLGLPLGGWPIAILLTLFLLLFFLPVFGRWVWRARPRTVPAEAFARAARGENRP